MSLFSLTRYLRRFWGSRRERDTSVGGGNGGEGERNEDDDIFAAEDCETAVLRPAETFGGVGETLEAQVFEHRGW